MLALVAATLMLTACNNYGTKVQVTPTAEVYYKGEGVTEADAKKLGDFLVQQGYFDSTKETTVQLLKEADTYVVKMVIDEEEVAKDKDFYKRFFWYLQQPIAEGVFSGAKTKIVFANDQLKDLETLGGIAKAATHANNRVLYNPEGITESDAKNLDAYFVQTGFFTGAKPMDILLQKDKDEYSVRFLVDEAALNADKEEIVTFFRVYKYMIGQDVFKGQKTKAYLTSLELKDIEPVADLTAEEKAAVDEANGANAAVPTGNTAAGN